MAAIAPVEVRAMAELIDELDYYQLLEVSSDAPGSQVKRAYYQVTRRLHPDHNRHLEGEDRQQLHRIARRIAEAYQVLRNAKRRNAYDEQLAGDAGGRHVGRYFLSTHRRNRAVFSQDHARTPQRHRH